MTLCEQTSRFGQIIWGKDSGVRRKALRNPRFWAVMAFILVVRMLPIAIALGVGLPLRSSVGTGPDLLITFAVLTASFQVLRRFAFVRLWSVFVRRILRVSDSS